MAISLDNNQLIELQNLSDQAKYPEELIKLSGVYE